MGQQSISSTQNFLISKEQLRERLRNRLSDNEINVLLGEIQANTRRIFQPGDLITADTMTYIFAKLAEIEDKLSSLTGSANGSKQIRIDSFEPLNKVSVGEILIINGANFSIPAILNTVVLTPVGSSVLTTPITIPLANYYQTESSPTRIKLQVPVFAGLPSSGLDFLVRVTNASGDTAQASYRLTAPATAARSRIFRFEPAAQVESGQKLSIIGENFDYPSRLNTVIFQPLGTGGANAPIVLTDEHFITYASQSTTSRITLQVPIINTIPSDGQDFLVRVSTSAGGTDELRYRLLPPIETSGLPPVITRVLNSDDGTTLRLGREVTVFGANFGANASDNIVNFVFPKRNGEETKYPVTEMIIEGEEINMKIKLKVPSNIDEVISGDGVTSGYLTIKVDGHPEANRSISVRP